MRVMLIAAAAFSAVAGTEENPAMKLTFACEKDNDLYRLLCADGAALPRVKTVEEAVARAAPGGGVLVLADGYPNTTTTLSAKIFEQAAAKKLRLYVEFPAFLPGFARETPRRTEWERGVVASGVFGAALAEGRILAIHDCHFVPVQAEDPWLAVARVAGFNTAVYGLPETVFPILFEHPSGQVLVATTKLSQFVTARYAPADAWKTVWTRILAWLLPSAPLRAPSAPLRVPGAQAPDLTWTPVVRPSFGPDEALPEDVEAQSFRHGAQWYFKAKLFVHPSWTDDRSGCPDRVGTQPEADWPMGDGTCGMLEGFSAQIRYDGSQPIRWWVRNDCNGEAAMAVAFHGSIEKDLRSRKTAENLGDFIYTLSETTRGPRDDPESPSFGLMSWDVCENQGVFYGDDNARSMLGTMACAALLDIDRWDRKMLRCLLANLRTTGTLGFRGGRIDQGPLHKNGWRHYFEAPAIHYAPHYEAYLWACFLWAYDKTRYPLFLERTKNALRMTMEAYPDEWRWTNGLQQERARMLLPLAWLVRIEDTPEHRAWLRRIAGDLLALQDACGAIREELGRTGHGAYEAPKSNEAYGTTEAPLIQANGDPLCDLLYTTNFAFVGLHEAAAATGDPYYAEAEERLAKFLCRIQIRSEAHPELDGGWFRAMDYKRWEYWASSADLGWGAWSIESGWTCGWIASVLAMRQLGTSFWELTQDSAIACHLDDLAPRMLSK